MKISEKRMVSYLMALLMPVLVSVPAKARERIYTCDFTEDVFHITSTMTTASVMVADAEWTVSCAKGATTSTGENMVSKEKCAKIILAKSKTGYFYLDSPYFQGFKIKSAHVTAWGTTSVQLSVKACKGVFKDNLTVAGTNTTTTKLNQNSTRFSFNGPQTIEEVLRIDFSNTTETASAVYLSKIEIIYDDGKPDPVPLPLDFIVDGEPVKSGCAVQKGSRFMVNVPDSVSDSLKYLTYTIGDNVSDDIVPEEGILLDSAGSFVFHFNGISNSEDWLDVTADFVVNVAGELETRDLTFGNAEDIGMTLFTEDSEEYETGIRWWSDGDVNYFFNEDEKVRFTDMGDGTSALTLGEAADLQISINEKGVTIIGAEFEGDNVDMLVARPQCEEDIPADNAVREGMSKRIRAEWSSAGDRVETLVISNPSDVKVNIKSMRLSIDSDTSTGVQDNIQSLIFPDGIYDIFGRSVRNMVSPGIYIVWKGGRSNKILK